MIILSFLQYKCYYLIQVGYKFVENMVLRNIKFLSILTLCPSVSYSMDNTTVVAVMTDTHEYNEYYSDIYKKSLDLGYKNNNVIIVFNGDFFNDHSPDGGRAAGERPDHRTNLATPDIMTTDGKQFRDLLNALSSIQNVDIVLNIGNHELSHYPSVLSKFLYNLGENHKVRVVNFNLDFSDPKISQAVQQSVSFGNVNLTGYCTSQVFNPIKDRNNPNKLYYDPSVWFTQKTTNPSERLSKALGSLNNPKGLNVVVAHASISEICPIVAKAKVDLKKTVVSTGHIHTEGNVDKVINGVRVASAKPFARSMRIIKVDSRGNLSGISEILLKSSDLEKISTPKSSESAKVEEKRPVSVLSKPSEKSSNPSKISTPRTSIFKNHPKPSESAKVEEKRPVSILSKPSEKSSNPSKISTPRTSIFKNHPKSSESPKVEEKRPVSILSKPSEKSSNPSKISTPRHSIFKNHPKSSGGVKFFAKHSK